MVNLSQMCSRLQMRNGVQYLKKGHGEFIWTLRDNELRSYREVASEFYQTIDSSSI